MAGAASAAYIISGGLVDANRSTEKYLKPKKVNQDDESQRIY